MHDIEPSLITTFLRELEENLWEVWSTFGRGPECSLHQGNNLIWFETPIPIIPFNGVLKFQLQSNPDQMIKEIADHFRKRKAQFMWVYHPSSEPHDLRERLLRYGLKDVEPIPGMARTLEGLEEIPAVPNGIEIRKVESERDASAFYQFAAWRWNVQEQHQARYESIARGFRFGEPGSKAHMWQAWHKGKPVAKAGMYLTSTSAGIYAVATRPEARRLGLARALTLAALHEARLQGYQVAVLHSTPMAERLYQSIGFATIAEFRLFASEEVYI
jgi:ribosomal protein S18 acetylase RimI-like enzyme